MSQQPEVFESYKQLDGHTSYYRHTSETCGGPMKFTAFVPPQARNRKLPALYWLSGLTCTEETFMLEGAAQSYAKKHELILIAPDTSPRNTGIPGETERTDVGCGASFYVDATEKKWASHFRMDSYVTQELRRVVEATLPVVTDRRGITGHSMGGHGALVLGLRNPDLYTSISAFAPICEPSQSPWGIRAFTEYLGSDRKNWERYDATRLLETTKRRTPILVDQGSEDEFLVEQLHTDAFEKAIRTRDYPATLRRHAGYDHSYFFISSFIEEHVAFHAKILHGH